MLVERSPGLPRTSWGPRRSQSPGSPVARLVTGTVVVMVLMVVVMEGGMIMVMMMMVMMVKMVVMVV